MKLGKATELVKKAAAVLKSKTGVVLGASRLLLMSSFRRRMAAVGGISHKMQALMAEAVDLEKAASHRGALVVVPRRRAAAEAMGEKKAVVDIARQLALFDHREDGGDGGGGYDDWAQALFNDDEGVGDEDDGGVLLLLDDEPLAMEVIRSKREVEGVEFNMDDEVDRAADMFIRRFRERMNRSF